jgi:hypothetical protein
MNHQLFVLKVNHKVLREEPERIDQVVVLANIVNIGHGAEFQPVAHSHSAMSLHRITGRATNG